MYSRLKPPASSRGYRGGASGDGGEGGMDPGESRLGVSGNGDTSLSCSVKSTACVGGKQAKTADRSLSQEKQGPKKTVFSILMVIYDVNK